MARFLHSSKVIVRVSPIHANEEMSKDVKNVVINLFIFTIDYFACKVRHKKNAPKVQYGVPFGVYGVFKLLVVQKNSLFLILL